MLQGNPFETELVVKDHKKTVQHEVEQLRQPGTAQGHRNVQRWLSWMAQGHRKVQRWLAAGSIDRQYSKETAD